MAYFYTSNYPQIYDNNYQYYHHQYNNNNYDSTNEDYSRYVQSTYEPQFHGNAYHCQQSPNPSLVGYYYSNYYQPESKNNAYIHENGGDYYYDDVVSTQYIVSYDTTTNGEAKKVENEVFFEEYNPEPFHGGYDINLTYGKPLPPSDDICYPTSKNEVVGNPPNVPSLDDKRTVESEAVSKQINDDDVHDDDDDDGYDDEEDDDDYDDDDGSEGGEEEKDELGKETMMVAPIASLGDALDKKEEDQKVDVGEKKDDFDKEKKKSVSFEDEIHEKDKNQNVGGVIQVETPSKIEAEKEQEQEQEKDLKDEGKKEEMNGSHEIRRQIPAGYGMESLDLCEGLFGGYFPCLWKRKQSNNNNIQESSSSYNYNEKLSDYDYEYCCKDTVDYLFGNPNPYGGSMPEKGSYGDPVYSYQRHYPQQPVTEQVDCYGGNSSWLQYSSRYYYGHNNGDYYQ